MDIQSFTAGYRAAAAVAISESESAHKDDAYFVVSGFQYTPHLVAALEKEETRLKRVLAGEDPYAAHREFLTY